MSNSINLYDVGRFEIIILLWHCPTVIYEGSYGCQMMWTFYLFSISVFKCPTVTNSFQISQILININPQLPQSVQSVPSSQCRDNILHYLDSSSIGYPLGLLKLMVFGSWTLTFLLILVDNKISFRDSVFMGQLTKVNPFL